MTEARAERKTGRSAGHSGGNPERKDFLVVGGGMVGATVAALLGRCGRSVTLVDAGPEPAWDLEGPVGMRVSAISPGSAAILDAAGAWQGIAGARNCPYRRMRVEDAQGGGEIDFDAGRFGMERLGTIVENGLVVKALWDELYTLPQVQCITEQAIESLEQNSDTVLCRLDDGRQLSADFLVACDGAASRTRRWLGIDGDSWDYNQRGVVGLVRKQQSNPGVAWQRFLPGGPLALLPLDNGWSSMVWTLPDSEAQEVLKLDDEAFRDRLETASEGWLGEVAEVGPRAAFPLSMRLSDHYLAGRVVLLGDAAHVVHPLAGQGVNLGLADAAALLESLMPETDDVFRALGQWERWRRSETALMAQGVHALGNLFRPAALSLPRRLGMAMVGRSWFLREAFLVRAAGQGSGAPRLARGESLAAISSTR